MLVAFFFVYGVGYCIGMQRRVAGTNNEKTCRGASHFAQVKHHNVGAFFVAHCLCHNLCKHLRFGFLIGFSCHFTQMFKGAKIQKKIVLAKYFLQRHFFSLKLITLH